MILAAASGPATGAARSCPLPLHGSRRDVGRVRVCPTLAHTETARGGGHALTWWLTTRLGRVAGKYPFAYPIYCKDVELPSYVDI